jgi:peptidoglycan/LPS O-acetylase OafA/YrhL
VTDGPIRIRTVDGLRGLAALLVVTDHAIDDSWGMGPWTDQNHGITIFALLTGFLLSSKFLRSRVKRAPRPALVPFLRARAARIFPAYWLAIGVAALTVGLHAMGPGDGWRIATLTQTFDTDTPYEGLIPTWSLSLFLSFYLLLPAWSYLRGRADRAGDPPALVLRREVKWLLGLIGFALVVRAFSLTDPIASDPAFSIFGRADWFAVGMILTAVVIARSDGIALGHVVRIGAHPWHAFGLAAAVTVAGGFLPAGMAEVRNWLDLTAAALIVYAAILHGHTLKGPQRLLASRAGQALGRWSYGIFLWGYVAEKAIADLFPGIGTGALLISTLVAGIALGAASWRLVEKPALRLLRERREKGRTDRAEPPAKGGPSAGAGSVGVRGASPQPA